MRPTDTVRSRRRPIAPHRPADRARPGAARAASRGGDGAVGAGTAGIAGPDPIGLGRIKPRCGRHRCVPFALPASDGPTAAPHPTAEPPTQTPLGPSLPAVPVLSWRADPSKSTGRKRDEPCRKSRSHLRSAGSFRTGSRPSRAEAFVVPESGALPLYVDTWGAIGIRPDGTLVEWSRDGGGRDVRPVEDRLWVMIALAAAARQYPELQELLPSRGPGAVDCECRTIPRSVSGLIYCDRCGRTGWLSAGDARPFVRLHRRRLRRPLSGWCQWPWPS